MSALRAHDLYDISDGLENAGMSAAGMWASASDAMDAQDEVVQCGPAGQWSLAGADDDGLEEDELDVEKELEEEEDLDDEDVDDELDADDDEDDDDDLDEFEDDELDDDDEDDDDEADEIDFTEDRYGRIPGEDDADV